MTACCHAPASWSGSGRSGGEVTIVEQALTELGQPVVGILEAATQAELMDRGGERLEAGVAERERPGQVVKPQPSAVALEAERVLRQLPGGHHLVLLKHVPLHDLPNDLSDPRAAAPEPRTEVANEPVDGHAAVASGGRDVHPRGAHPPLGRT